MNKKIVINVTVEYYCKRRIYVFLFLNKKTKLDRHLCVRVALSSIDFVFN